MGTEVVTPDGITEEGKKLVTRVLSEKKWDPEAIAKAINSIDSIRTILLSRADGAKFVDGAKKFMPIPFLKSTPEKINAGVLDLLKAVPNDIEEMKVRLNDIVKGSGAPA